MTTTYTDLTVNALIESIKYQANQYAGPTIKIQVLEICKNNQEQIKIFIDQLIDLYHQTYSNLEEAFICLKAICDLEYAFLDGPITEDEDYIPDPLYNFIMAKGESSNNKPADVLHAKENPQYKSNTILTLKSKSFVELIEICENIAISNFSSSDSSIKEAATKDIANLAEIRRSHGQKKDNIGIKILKFLGIIKKNSLDIAEEKLYK